MQAFIVQLIIAIVLALISFVLMPRPKTPKPPAAGTLDNPTAEAGRPIIVVFGTMTIKSPNVLWYGEKKTIQVDMEDEDDGGGVF